MPKRSSTSKDPNVWAKSVVDQIIQRYDPEASKENEDMEREKNPAAVELGRLGGKKGGPARAKKLSEKKRKQIARKAAKARWSKQSRE